MKKRIIISIVIILLGIAGMVAFTYLSSLHKVSVTFSKDVTSATVYDEKGGEVKKIGKAGDITLQNGNYNIVPDGEKISKEKIPLVVKDTNQSINLDPDYSKDFLGNALKNEQTAITKEMTSSFPLIATDYSIQDGTLLHHGEWYAALLTRNVSDIRDVRDFYRILLHKESDSWKVVEKPELVLTKSEFKDVPVKIIDAVNQLSE